jgi:DNA end-binding protein Ku
MAKKRGTRKKAAKKKTARRREEGKDRERGAAGQGPGTRPMWSGHIRLSLVSVPVKLYAATRAGGRIAFHQVHEPSGKRVRYQKIVPGIGPIDTDEIVKGYELERGRYVLLEPEEVESLKLETKKTLDLVQFVSQGEIDPIWFDRPYYVVADGELAEEAYGVIRDALRESRRLGLGQLVMRGREYIAALKPCGHGLLLETLRFADEVREAAPFFAGIDAGKADKDLLALAQELIDRKTAPFRPEEFKDQYTEAVRELIEARRKHEPVEVSEEAPPAAAGGKVIDLVEALKRSVKKEEEARAGSGSSRRRKAG